MSGSADRKYQSGREVLEAFIPGYVPPKAASEEDTAEHRQAQTPEELKDALLSGLKAKLDQLNLTIPSS
ncbi:MAG TPA: hypothetical protein VKA46_15830 [Gemmataceae bacterium]|nr:hypothetical protein [Gemmataceae bacterium]